MKLRKAALVVTVSVLALTSSGLAQARGGHWGWGGFGWGFGIAAAALTFPFWAARPYYNPYYGHAYYPSYGYAPNYGYAGYGYGPSAPAQYVERAQLEQRAVPQQSPSYFFCQSTNSYYPYARQCPGGWQRIPASPVGV